MSVEPWDLAVVGGGAAGVFAAIIAAESTPGLRVLVLEGSPHPLSKVRVSGGGRCNVTHHAFDPAILVQHYPRGHRELRGPFSRFQPRDMIAWLKSHGVRTHTEADGRVFPVGDDSKVIVDALMDAFRESGCRLYTRCRVVSCLKDEDGFELRTEGGVGHRAKRLLLATGGHPSGYSLAQGLGHTLVPPVPSLFTLKIRHPLIDGLEGLSFEKVCLSLVFGRNRFAQEGALLITHWGLSGPAMLKLSAWAARDLHACGYRGELVVNWAPGSPVETLRAGLRELTANGGKKHLLNADNPWVPKRLWQRMIEVTGIDPQKPCRECGKREWELLGQVISRSVLGFEGKSTNKEEFVTAGGVSLKEVDLRTMESKQTPGLYFAGELLDVDGVTGGFNFQHAWTSGYIAARSVAGA